MIKRLDSGLWFVDIEPTKGKRFRRQFKTKAEAVRFESYTRQAVAVSSPWLPEKKDSRRLSDLINEWFHLHGSTLSDGVRRKTILLTLSEALNDPIGSKLKGSDFAAYRAVELGKGVNAKSLNNRLGYLKAVFNYLQKMGVINYDNPLKQVQAVSLQEKPLGFLTQAQIKELIQLLTDKCQAQVVLIALVCLSTGCRWSEAQSLTLERIHSGQVEFINTKSKRRRSVPIPPALSQKLRDHLQTVGAFTNCINSFDKVVRGSALNLPAGQSTHILRHTFASHFIMNGGNLLTLQKILGHSSLSMTLRYAHLSPDHLQEAVSLSPVRDYF